MRDRRRDCTIGVGPAQSGRFNFWSSTLFPSDSGCFVWNADSTNTGDAWLLPDGALGSGPWGPGITAWQSTAGWCCTARPTGVRNQARRCITCYSGAQASILSFHGGERRSLGTVAGLTCCTRPLTTDSCSECRWPGPGCCAAALNHTRQPASGSTIPTRSPVVPSTPTHCTPPST